MIFARVRGTVVGTARSDAIAGAKFLLVEVCTHKGEGKKSYIVALDLVSAGIGEMVLLAQGSSSRQTSMTYEKPIDAVIVGIIDTIEEKGRRAFTK
jgi:ethanolamine utilization protein EutN/carbon dioxide concentrating mechanism protein CcmL